MWDCMTDTAQKMKFSIKDFFSKCDQILTFLRIRLHLLKKSLMESFILCAVRDQGQYFWKAMTLIYEKEVDPDPPNQWKILSVLTVFKYFPPPTKVFFFRVTSYYPLFLSWLIRAPGSTYLLGYFNWFHLEKSTPLFPVQKRYLSIPDAK